MASLTGMWWRIVFPSVYFLSGITAVTIEVTSPISAHLQDQNVTLPCEFALENPNSKFAIRWGIDNDIVMKRDSDGDVYPGDRYTDNALLGDGCSLVLLKPQIDDTGTYTVRILASDDSEQEATARVSLVVTAKFSTGGATQTSTDRRISAPKDKSSEDEVGYLTGVITLLLLSTLCLFFQFYLSITDVLSKRGDETPQQRNRRVCRYILSRAVFILLITVLVVLSWFGFVERNTALLLGCASTLIIAFGIQCFYMRRYMHLQ